MWGAGGRYVFLLILILLENLGGVCNFTYVFHSHWQAYLLNRIIANTLFLLFDSLWVTAE